jgi:8-oxo-dGTP pyrophosphatase MutT (NUDIX family)
LIEAAGGVVVRDPAGGDPQVAVIHRPRYDDWSLPKGKLERGEGWAQAAVREVEEEKGYRCTPVRELGSVRYTDRKGRPKTVRYWLMESVGGSFEPNDEADELRWVGGREAAELLTYPHDRELVAEALSKAEKKSI